MLLRWLNEIILPVCSSTSTKQVEKRHLKEDAKDYMTYNEQLISFKRNNMLQHLCFYESKTINENQATQPTKSITQQQKVLAK